MNGMIAWMARNGVAANLLMMLLLVAGAVSVQQIPTKVFPEFTLSAVQVEVEYRGASPEEIEDSVIQPIEEAIEAVEGVDAITATAAEGLGIVTAELKEGVSVSRKVDEVQAEVNRITNLPDRAERPQVSEIDNRQRVIELVIYGDVPPASLKEIAYRFEDELAARDAISLVEVAGVRDDEISVEVSKEQLRAYDLSLPEIARLIGQNSVDLPAGGVETRGEDIQLRVEAQNYSRSEFEDIVLVAGEGGAQVRLGDIATVTDGFRDSGLVTRFEGRPAAAVQVFRVGDEQALAVAAEVERYIDEQEDSLPPGVSVMIWQNEANELRSRLSLLIESAVLGAILVIVTLALFLDLRVAFWVSFGIVVSFVGTFAVMGLADLSINQLSLFGFILALGILVDDAVVVGENIYAAREKGASGIDAAVKGTQRVVRPVVFAVLTTMTAFSLLVFLPGTTGKFLYAIPVIVIIALGLSLVESLLILPHHLSGMKEGEPDNPVLRPHGRLRAWFDERLARFRDGPLDKSVRFAVAHYMVVMAGLAGLLAIVAVLFSAGYIKFVFFPQIEGQFVTAELEMPQGTPAPVTLAVADHVRDTGQRVAAQFEEERGNDESEAPPLLEGTYTTIGRLPQSGRGPGGGETPFIQPSVATIRFKLSEPDERDISARRFREKLREEVGDLAGVRSLSYSASLVSVGDPVVAELSADTEEELQRAVERVRAALNEQPGVVEIRDDLSEGQRELELELLPQARNFGLARQDLAQQVRAATFGAEAVRIQRGREEVRVYVRLPEDERDALEDLADYRIRPPDSPASIPFGEVADVEYGSAPSTIDRRDGRRIITVRADVVSGVTTGSDVTEKLRRDVLPTLREDIPSLDWSFGGEQREQGEVVPALLRNLALALFAIYALLAVPLRSYTQPLVILSAVPLGLVGAVFGHLLLGLDLTILSLIGIVGLAGVVVNDALLLVDFMNERRIEGEEIGTAIVEAAKSRWRPILLTSMTTFFGILPLIAAQSVQARFLVPLAASVAFGVLFATFVQMVVVTALAKAHADALVAIKSRLKGKRADEVEVVHAATAGAAS
ncbi:efflux RND transporter permease subunit [Erythrobacter sp. HL-111]|uniref:efflux RND transporter permease subunit n=1 Tax=Erythrobacter sp. HL-111 TaxID=1798193 RepID=UPI0006DA838B|nr:efflux RND transporter permease subunit [Erythrobacter sp. HL-111]KPP91221.1 MAG: HAE1 family RND-type efflux pump permease component [Erythrobacteraceae bacterium HL-111]SDT06355.1 Multidrug efflux pump subunit AcrB [Erythrobacter sp. HL-111]